MTFSSLEYRIVAIGLKLSVVLGFLASLSLVASLFMAGPTGPRLLGLCGCVLSLVVVSIVYLGVTLAVIERWRRGEGA